jgi:hypothetical protein
MQIDIEKNVSESMEFLRRWDPQGPWVLTSIDPDRKAISTVTFHPSKMEDLRAWLSQYNGTRNIYFHVNRVTGPLVKKAERTDIASVTWLHVDIDPRVGEDIAEERTRALRLLREFRPAPTVIVDSGGGFQGFWRLRDPIEINGELAKAEDAKRYNIQLELTFGADNCHNIDRIMRLPGTLNIPDAKKRKKGRTIALANVVEFNDNSYEISQFTKAPEVQSAADQGFSAQTVQVSGNVQRLADVDELPENVPGRVKVLIVQGTDPDEPTKYSSRSEALFAVCTALVKAGVDDNTIFAVITDPDFGISASVLDKKRPEKYAVRQIERAREEAIHPQLRILNEKHAVIGDMGGKCRVISDLYDHAMKRATISRQSFDDFRNRYMHIMVEVGMSKDGKPLTKKLGHWWLEHPLHRHYETICFAPGVDVPGSYNLWKGYGCEARPGDCSLFLEHIRENLCSRNERHFDYLMNWLARAVQQPGSPGEVAIVLKGRRGTGKSMFARTIGSLFGRHFLHVSDPKHLVGSFNSHLRDCIILFGDEAFFAGDKKHESVLKTLITEPYITFEAKGVDAESGPNYTHLIMASNDSWVVPAGNDERRYFVLDVADTQMQNSAYFAKIMHQLDNGGREALLHDLMTRDISEFEVRSVPKTEALQEQKLLSMSQEEEWWFNKLTEGRLLSNHTEWRGEVEKEELFQDFYNYMQKLGSYRRASKTSLTRFLGNVCPRGFPETKQRWVDREVIGGDGWKTTRRDRPYFYMFPDLGECRKLWDSKFGGGSNWPADDNTPEPPKTATDLPF